MVSVSWLSCVLGGKQTQAWLSNKSAVLVLVFDDDPTSDNVPLRLDISFKEMLLRDCLLLRLGFLLSESECVVVMFVCIHPQL